MRTRTFGGVVLFLALLIAGCGGKNSDKVIGVWKSVNKEGGRHQFVEIAKEKMDIDGNAADVVLEDRDGKVSVRLAGRDDVVAVITVVDDKNIEIVFTGPLGGKLALVKSTQEERNATEHPPVEKILGYWRSNRGDSDEGTSPILEIGKDYIAYGTEKVTVSIETRKGQYSISGTDGFAGTIDQTDENTIQTATMKFRGAFTRTTKAEVDALIEKARIALQPYLGMWRSEKASGFQNEFTVLEIGEDYFIRNGEKSQATLSVTKKGLHISYGLLKDMSLSLKDENTATAGSGWNTTTFFRTSPEEMKKLEDPDINDFKGMWILDSDMSTYKALAVDGNAIYRDGLKQSFDIESPGPNQLRLFQPGSRDFTLAWLSHAGPDSIIVKNTGALAQKFEAYYKRATKEEFAKALEGMVDSFGVIPGYWRSADPVTDKGAYATMFVQYNVQGQKVKGLCDRVEHHFLEQGNRNPRTDLTNRIVEGVIGHPDGDTSKPISLLTIESGSRWYLNFNVQTVNAMEVTYAYGKPIQMLRSTKEENDRLRAAVKQK